MHPYQHVFFHGPSRLFWFFVGASAATWWHHSSIMRDHRAQYFPCVAHHRRVHDSPSGSSVQEAAALKSPLGSDRAPVGQVEWEQDKERWRHLQKRAGETVVDLSESTLDSIVAGAESLKTKLAQLRVERELFEAQKKAAREDA